MKIYGINTCQTYKKALKWFDQNHITYKAIDYRKEPLNQDMIKQAHSKSGLPINKFLNTSGKLYKTYQLKEKREEMTLNEIYDLLSREPMLIKRPLIIDRDKVVVGFNEKVYKEMWVDNV